MIEGQKLINFYLRCSFKMLIESKQIASKYLDVPKFKYFDVPKFKYSQLTR